MSVVSCMNIWIDTYVEIHARQEAVAAIGPMVLYYKSEKLNVYDL